jgi:uncharacterized NAD(P)/FAD-binding protein YdhS
MLVDRRPRRIMIFEPNPELAAGAAYSTDEPRHLLNVPASGMSAFEDQPAHFVTWLADRRLGYGPTDFVPRRLYRQYLQSVLRVGYHQAVPGTDLIWVPELVSSVHLDEAGGRGATLGYGDGQRCHADSVVLALGAPGPAAVAALDVPPAAAIVRDPWRPGSLDSLASSGDILILGTGLTMIDVALVVADRDPRRVIHARSRHGLLPAEHVADGFVPWPGFDIGRPSTARDVLSRLRLATAEAESDGWNWRNVIAAARIAAPEVWRGLSPSERRRLLRHLGRQWDVSRHRVSPPVAADVEHLRRCGRLTVNAGRVMSMVVGGDRERPTLQVELAGPGGRHESLEVSALIDCTGPGPDATAGSPLVAGLVSDGLACPHPTGIGLDVDDHGALCTPFGHSTSIHTVGWCRRGAEFESTAVPEIRRQAARLARQLTTSVPPHHAPVLVSA